MRSLPVTCDLFGWVSSRVGHVALSQYVCIVIRKKTYLACHTRIFIALEGIRN